MSELSVSYYYAVSVAKRNFKRNYWSCIAGLHFGIRKDNLKHEIQERFRCYDFSDFSVLDASRCITESVFFSGEHTSAVFDTNSVIKLSGVGLSIPLIEF